MSAMPIPGNIPPWSRRCVCRISRFAQDADKAFRIVRRIARLWLQVATTPIDSPDYPSLIVEIRALSEEHQALLEAARKLRADTKEE
jgi:hypothetical protein